MRITPKDRFTKLELDKRTYLPFDVTSTCPKCGVEVTVDLTSNYLSYPTVGEGAPVYFAHMAGDDDHEWDECVVVGLTLTPYAFQEAP